MARRSSLSTRTKRSKPFAFYRYKSRNKNLSNEQLEELAAKSREEKYKELFNSIIGDCPEKVEKLINNVLYDSNNVQIIRNDRSYEIVYEINNKDESHLTLMIYKDSMDINVRINNDTSICVDLQFSLIDRFEPILDEMFIKQQIHGLNKCINEFYDLTHLDRKDKIASLNL